MLSKEEVMERLLKEIIHDDGLREKTRIFLSPIWSELCDIPASKTGKYHHPSENVVPYGLINHVIRGLYFMEQLCKEEGIADMDEMTCSMILHDVGKRLYHKPRYINIDHSIEGSKEVREAGFSLEICLMVKNHMHHWDGHIPTNIKERIIAYADYLASRRELEIAGLDYFNYPPENVFK